MNRRGAVLSVGATMLAACAPGTDEAQVAAKPAPQKLPNVMVYKSEGCGCCDLWVEHLRRAGFTAEVQELPDMAATKERVGIPPTMGSCHTAEVAGYFVEGHVPAEDILRLLAQRPDARGLTVPAMPIGSPGMEVPGRSEPYEVLLVARDGASTVFARHGG